MDPPHANFLPLESSPVLVWDSFPGVSFCRKQPKLKLASQIPAHLRVLPTRRLALNWSWQHASTQTVLRHVLGAFDWTKFLGSIWMIRKQRGRSLRTSVVWRRSVLLNENGACQKKHIILIPRRYAILMASRQECLQTILITLKLCYCWHKTR